MEDGDVSRFLTAWFAVRQIIQAANFNHFHKAGLSATQFMTLNLLPVKEESISIGELARRMNLRPSTVAKTVDSLETRKMLERTRSEADRRLVLVRITEQGRTLQNAAVGRFREHIGAIFQEMPAPDRAALIQGLESLVGVAAARSTPHQVDATPDERGAAPETRNSRQSPAR